MIRKPFKGSFYYEWQLGPFVLQWAHGETYQREGKRFGVWRDPYWRSA